jgi:hypothetical protein
MGNGDAEGKGKGGKGGLGRLLTVLLVLIVILFIAAFVVARMEVGRDFIKGRLEKQLGLELTVGSTSLMLPFEVVIDQIESKNFDFGVKPGFKAREIRIAPRLFSPTGVSVLRGELTLMRSQDGVWAPTGFSRLGDVPLRNIAEISRVTRGFRKDVTIHVTDGSIVWLDSTELEIASASGILFDMAPVSLPEQTLYYHHLVVYNMLGVDGMRVHDVEREWLSSDTRDYIELHRSGKPIPVSGRQFWEISE